MIPASVVQAVVPKKKNPWWKVSLVFLVIFFIMMAIDSGDDGYEGDTYSAHNSDGYFQIWYVCENGKSIEEEAVNDGHDDCGDWSDEYGEESDTVSIIGSGSCCLSLVFGMAWLVTSMESKEKVLIVQQRPQYVPVVQQVQPVIVQQRPPVIQQPPVGIPANVSRKQLLQQAQNMERARDFENAAELYQKAGSYEDAGRVRQAHLEKEQAMVKIGQVGNTVLNDSVMMNNGSPAETTCWACQQPIQQGWNVCPHCQASL